MSQQRTDMFPTEAGTVAGPEGTSTLNDILLDRFDDIIRRASGDAPLKATFLSYYATIKIQPFWRHGREADLAEAVDKESQDLAKTKSDDPEYTDRLSLFGTILESRYERLANTNDLGNAVRISRQAIEVTPPDHSKLAGRLNNLGNKMQSRFERMGTMGDLEEAIRVSRQAVEATPLDHPNLAGWLNNLGNKLQSRFERMGTLEDLQEAIRVTQQAVEVTSLDHPDLAGRLNNLLSRDRVDSVVKMVLAQDGATSVAGIFSSDLRTLVRSIDAIVTADHLNSYLRRFALARLAKSYNDTVVNGGHLVDSEPNMSSLRKMTTKESKSEAYVSLIQHTWDVEFRGRYRGQRKTQSGLINFDASDAVRWNQYRRKLGKQIDAGQRWLTFAERFGWSSLGLISRNWSIGDNKVAARDRIFEETLTSSEHELLLNEIEGLKGRFLRQLNKALGGGLFDLLEGSSRAKDLPLLGMNHEDILTRPDCDQRWLNEMDCQRSPSVAE